MNIDDNLFEDAKRLTGIKGRTALIRESLRALVERESAHKLAELGGSEPQLEYAPRRRSVVCREPRARRTDDGIDILPAETFAQRLWSGEVV